MYNDDYDLEQVLNRLNDCLTHEQMIQGMSFYHVHNSYYNAILIGDVPIWSDDCDDNMGDDGPIKPLEEHILDEVHKYANELLSLKLKK